jgi:thiol-disulfide isomerase/thioredoxin
MTPKINDFLRRHFGRILLFGGVGAYAVIASSTGSWPTRALIANSIGLPSLVPSAQAVEASPSITASAWELKDVEGKTVRSSDFAGKVVVLDFWATWCPPCRAEIPGFVELQKQYGDKGLVIVGVSLDQQGPEVVTPFMKQFSMNYPVVMGDAKIVQAFGGISGIPTTFVIDRSGKIVSGRVGFAPKETFEKEIVPLL